VSNSTQTTSQTGRSNALMLIGIVIGLLVGMVIDSIPSATVGGLVIGATIDYIRYHLKINP
jgi:hypothetical protein